MMPEHITDQGCGTLLARLTHRFGADIAQEAITRTLEHDASPSYAWQVAKHLALWHYHDGMAPTKRQQDLLGVIPSRTTGIDPYRIASARQTLRTIPTFIVEWHVKDGFQW